MRCWQCVEGLSWSGDGSPNLSPTTINSRLSQLPYRDFFPDCFVPLTQEGNQEEQRENGFTSARSQRKNNFGDMPGTELIKVVVDLPPFLF